ncbi:MAG TPA: SdpI family protein [Desulfosporosinus sp.]
MQKISSTLKKDWLILMFVFLGLALGVYFYPSLPDKIPVHWGFNGEVNGYGSKLVGAFALPLINLGMYIMFLVLPYIEPKGDNYAKFDSTYQYLKYLLIILFFGLEVYTLLLATGIIVNRPIYIGISSSLLFILLGNVIGRFKYNYFIGFKIPWTLVNEEVWRKTHRLAAPLFVIGGIINLVLNLIGTKLIGIGLMITVAVIIIVPTVYSYFAYQKIVKG